MMVTDSSPVDGHVKDLRKDEQRDIVTSEANQHLITAKVIRRIIRAVHLLLVKQSKPCSSLGRLTFAPMMFDVCTVMLYSADATVRVRTVPALRLVMATMIACA
jgi:hypothetical protein